jgi:AraC-like DNA-binding protein
MAGTVGVAGEPPTMQFEAFREAVSHTFVPLLAETGDENTFTGAVAQNELGSLLLADVTAGSHVVRRNSRLIRRADPGCYKLTLQVAGSAMISQDGREAVLRPGDLTLYDTTRPYELRFDGPFRMIVLMFSRSLLQVPESSVRLLTGHRIPGDNGLGMLVGPFVSGLLRRPDSAATPTDSRLCDAVLDMLAAALLDELSAGDALPNGPRQTVLVQRIKSYIDEGLADPDLSPATVAAAHHISPRYLRKLFEGEGEGVARWIRSRRLEQCRRDLSRLELCDRSVSAVAGRWGFTDAAHFSRLFKSTYGQPPREYRHVAMASARPTVPRTA